MRAAVRASAWILGAGLALTAPPAARAQEKGEGPASLILTYKCKPENRPAFRTYMAGKGLARLEAWKAQGRFKDYLALFASTVGASSWDMLLRLDFDHYADTGGWYEIEKTDPGGLAPEGLALCSPASANLADLGWSGAAPARTPATSVYLVIPYDYRARAEYKGYVDTYVTPQARGWIREGILSSYSLYLNQNEAGPAWDSLFVLEYKDLASLARRRAVINKVREELSKDPVWKTVSDLKQELRTEGEVVLAHPLNPH